MLPFKKCDCIKRLKLSVYMKRSKSAPDYYESVHGYWYSLNVHVYGAHMSVIQPKSDTE